MTTIHMTGQRANTAPAAMELKARERGRLQTAVAMISADDQPGQRRLPRRPAQDAEQDENDRHGKRRHDEGERQAAGDGRQQLLEHWSFLPRPVAGEPRSFPDPRIGAALFIRRRSGESS